MLDMAQAPNKCDLCETSLKVTCKCLDCDKLFCDHCTEIHKRDENHDMFYFNEGSTGTVRISKCKIHPEYSCYNFCVTCDELVCPRCLSQSHGSGNHVIEESEKVFWQKKAKLDEHYDKIKNDMLIFLAKEDKKVDELQSLHKYHYLEEKQNIQKQDERLKDEITHYTNKLMNELEEFWDEVQLKFQVNKSHLEEQILELTNKISVLDKIKNSNDVSTLCLFDKETAAFINNTDISFVELPMETKVLQKKTEKAICELKIVPLTDSTFIEFRQMQAYETNFKKISSIVKGPKDTIWIKDGSSSCIKNINLEHELPIINEKSYSDEHVADIALTKSGELIIAFIDDPCIKIATETFNVKPFYTFPKRLLTKPQVALSLHVLNDGKIIVGAVEKDGRQYSLTDKSHRQLVILNENKEPEKVIEYNSDGSRLFIRPRRITSDDKGDIYVIDRTHLDFGRVIAFDQDHIMKWTYNCQTKIHPDKHGHFDPCSIVTTSQNNIIVCDNSNNAFHILSNGGHIITFIQTEELEILRPFSMEINKKGQLIVGSDPIQQRKAKLYLLQFTGC
ncbi:uncharacterized protein [Mytilus edulis]|uniref:uncharacterized protein n=1 Tax=Mytilus edulis TaxID=6550 RepID=UPI0039EE958B